MGRRRGRHRAGGGRGVGRRPGRRRSRARDRRRAPAPRSAGRAGAGDPSTNGDRASRARVIGDGTVVGPYATIGPHVVDRPALHASARRASSTAGRRSATTREICAARVDRARAAGPEVSAASRRGSSIGHHNVFREFVTIHRGTAGGGGVTTIGDHNLFMAYAHVAHDCHVGSSHHLRQRRDARRPRDGRGLTRRSAPIPACISSAASASTPSSAATPSSRATRCRTRRRSATARGSTA